MEKYIDSVDLEDIRNPAMNKYMSTSHIVQAEQFDADKTPLPLHVARCAAESTFDSEYFVEYPDNPPLPLNDGDYIVLWPKGEVFVRHPHDFHEVYERHWNIEDQLQHAICRLAEHQNSPMKCVENETAIYHVVKAIDCLVERTRLRYSQRLTGTQTPHKS